MSDLVILVLFGFIPMGFLFTYMFLLFLDAKPPLWVDTLWNRVKLRALKAFKSDRPVVGYDLLELVDGKFRLVATSGENDPFGTQSLFIYQDREEAIQKASPFRRQFLAEILLYGEVKDNAHTYRSTEHRVLQIVSLGEPVRGLFSRSKVVENLQPLLDQLQEQAGVIQPLRYVQNLKDFEPTVIEKSRRRISREYKIRDYYAEVKNFYARDDLTVAPGLYAVSSKSSAKAVSKTKRSKRSRDSSLPGLLEELRSRVAETSGRKLQKTLKLLLGQLGELATKATHSDAAQGVKLLEVKHRASVQRLLELSSPDYYGSFLRNPERWSDPERMALQVELAAITLTRTLTEDLRNLNAPRELEFQLSVRSLVGRNTEVRSSGIDAVAVNSLLQDTASGEGDLQGDLESLRVAVAHEEAVLLAEEREPRSLKKMILG